MIARSQRGRSVGHADSPMTAPGVACRVSSTKIRSELFGQLPLASKLPPFRFQGRQVFERYLAAIEAWPSIPPLAPLMPASSYIPTTCHCERAATASVRTNFQKLRAVCFLIPGLAPGATLSAIIPAQEEMAKAANSSTRAAGFRNGIASARIGHQGAVGKMFGRVRVDLSTAGLLLGASHQ